MQLRAPCHFGQDATSCATAHLPVGLSLAPPPLRQLCDQRGELVARNSAFLLQSCQPSHLVSQGSRHWFGLDEHLRQARESVWRQQRCDVVKPRIVSSSLRVCRHGALGYALRMAGRVCQDGHERQNDRISCLYCCCGEIRMQVWIAEHDPGQCRGQEYGRLDKATTASTDTVRDPERASLGLVLDRPQPVAYITQKVAEVKSVGVVAAGNSQHSSREGHGCQNPLDCCTTAEAVCAVARVDSANVQIKSAFQFGAERRIPLQRVP